MAFLALFSTALLRNIYSDYLTVSLINHTGCTAAEATTGSEKSVVVVDVDVTIEGRQEKGGTERTDRVGSVGKVGQRRP